MNRKILLEALSLAHRVTGFAFLKQILRFGCTGLLGTVTNFVLFYLTIIHWQILGLNTGAVLAFLLSASQNYVVNSLWTFRAMKIGKGFLTVSKWLKFLASSLFGLGINLAVLNVLLYAEWVTDKLWAQCIGVFAAMSVNFLISKYYVFGKQREKEVSLL